MATQKKIRKTENKYQEASVAGILKLSTVDDRLQMKSRSLGYLWRENLGFHRSTVFNRIEHCLAIFMCLSDVVFNLLNRLTGVPK